MYTFTFTCTCTYLYIYKCVYLYLHVSMVGFHKPPPLRQEHAVSSTFVLLVHCRADPMRTLNIHPCTVDTSETVPRPVYIQWCCGRPSGAEREMAMAEKGSGSRHKWLLHLVFECHRPRACIWRLHKCASVSL